LTDVRILERQQMKPKNNRVRGWRVHDPWTASVACTNANILRQYALLDIGSPSCELLRPSATSNSRRSQQIAAWSRSIAVTPKCRSQRIVVFRVFALHSKCKSSKCTETLQRVDYNNSDCTTIYTDCDCVRSAVVHCRSRLLLRSFYTRSTVAFDRAWSQLGQHSRSAVAVHSCDLRRSAVAARLWTIVLRPQYELCERRQTAYRVHCDRNVAARNYEQFKILFLSDLQRPTTTKLRPYWDLMAICRD